MACGAGPASGSTRGVPPGISSLRAPSARRTPGEIHVPPGSSLGTGAPGSEAARWMPWHTLYLRAEPHQHGSLRPGESRGFKRAPSVSAGMTCSSRSPLHAESVLLHQSSGGRMGETMPRLRRQSVNRERQTLINGHVIPPPMTRPAPTAGGRSRRRGRQPRAGSASLPLASSGRGDP